MYWKECGDCESDGYRVVYSGGNESQRGVAVVLDKETAKRVTDIERISDRLMMVKIQAEPVNMIIIQIYMPTTDHEDDEVDLVYEQFEELLEKQKGTENVVITGDRNAVVEEGRHGNEVGMYELGQRNDKGDKLVEFCKRNVYSYKHLVSAAYEEIHMEETR